MTAPTPAELIAFVRREVASLTADAEAFGFGYQHPHMLRLRLFSALLSVLEGRGSGTADAARLTAKAIAWDEAGDETNGYASWESNHSCGMGRYGCCGDGKDIDRKVLAKLIEDALALASSPPSVATGADQERICVLERAIGNCFMMAKRQIAAHMHGTNTPQRDLERWQHVQRFCETTGSKSDILRGQLPTEITEGAAPSRVAPPSGAQIAAFLFGDWHDDDGSALWWRFPIMEPPYSGCPLSSDWPFDGVDKMELGWTRFVIPKQGATFHSAASPLAGSTEPECARLIADLRELNDDTEHDRPLDDTWTSWAADVARRAIAALEARASASPPPVSPDVKTLLATWRKRAADDARYNRGWSDGKWSQAANELEDLLGSPMPASGPSDERPA